MKKSPAIAEAKAPSPYLTTPYKAPATTKKTATSSSSPIPTTTNGSKQSKSPVKTKQNQQPENNGVSAQLSEKKASPLISKTASNSTPKKTATTTTTDNPNTPTKQNSSPNHTSPSSIEKSKGKESSTPTKTTSTKTATSKTTPTSTGKSTTTVTKSSAIIKSSSTKSSSNKNAVFKKIPSDVVLIILDYYGGIFKKSTITEKDGKIEYSSFIKKFYGRFSVDKSVKFMFRFIEGDHQAINNMKESIELVRLAFVGSSKVRIAGSVADYLLNCPNKADPSLAMRKLELFASSLGDDCKKVSEVDFVGRETFSELCSLFFKTFTNLEIIKGGRHMRKRRDNDYDTRFHAFDTSMASALEVTGPNVKEIKWLGSTLPKNLASFTPNLETIHIGKLF
ncbi:predicted protein [Naegleria gruberi]|uniref:Predicted protein n=1 Tax=Naegleria gruberi TaxID=5762 RepID=D2V2S6_NAEGR|nr:uncharacterized protein NAEGRDRAFT_46237 [Naegleria gruberi]EFC48949.1 predicted protein [Naegleria gruberi]|eukprot:XP_002681693.1 predicted protein [Naegleria gruberi strain NEG-M]